MECAKVQNALIAGEARERFAAHLAECDACRAVAEDNGATGRLLAAGDGEAPIDLDLATLERSVTAAVAADRGPLAWLRSRTRAARLLYIAAVVAAWVGLVLLVRPRRDLDDYPVGRLLLGVVTMTFIAGAAAWTALRPLYLPPVPRAVGRLLVPLSLLVAALVVFPELPTNATSAAGYHWLSWLYECLPLGTAGGLAVLVAARPAHRGGVEVVATAAAAAGLAGALGLLLSCPYNYADHILLGHATVPLGVLVVLWAFSRRG